MKILGRNVLVKPFDQSGVTRGGICLPQSANDVPWMANQEGVVVAIGSQIREEREFEKGTRVFIAMYAAKEIEVRGERRLIVPLDAVVGVAVNGGDFHPIGPKILVQQIRTVSRETMIIRPNAYENDENALVECRVHLLGSGVRRKNGKIEPFEVKKGDHVLVKSFAGREVDTLDGVFMLIEQKNIEAVIIN